MEEKTRSYPTSLYIVALVVCKKDNQMYLLLDNDLNLPLSMFTTKSLNPTLATILQYYNVLKGNYEGILSVHSSFHNGIYEFTFFVYCSVEGEAIIEASNIHILDGKLIETITQKSSIPSWIARESGRLLETFGSWPMLKELNKPESHPKICNTLPPFSHLVTFVIIIENGKILLIEETPEKGGGWFLPAGHFENEEDLISVSKRETKEEAGVEIEVDQILQIIYKWGAILDFVVTGKIVGGELKKIPDHESQGAMWFDLKMVLQEVKNSEKRKYRKPWELEHIFENVFTDDGIIKNSIPII